MTPAEELEKIHRILPAKSSVFCGPANSKKKYFLEAFDADQIVHFSSDFILRNGDAPNFPPGSDLINTVLSDSNGKEVAYISRNRAISGLIRPESLHEFWRNAETLREVEVRVSTLDKAISDHASHYPNAKELNWLVVDELAAGKILRGAEQTIGQCDVIVVKAINAKIRENGLSDCTISSITTHLRALAFRLFSMSIEQHPAIVTATFIRDWKLTATETRDSFDRQLQASSARVAEQISQIQSIETQLSELGEALTSSEAQRNTLQNTVRELTRSELAQRTLAEERKAQIEAQLDEIEKLRSQCSALAQNQEAERADLSAQKSAIIEDYKSEAAKTNKGIGDIQGALSALAQSVQDTRYVQFSTASGSKSKQIERIILRADECYNDRDFKRAAEFYQLALHRDQKTPWALQGLAEAITRFDYRKDPNWTLQDRVEAIEVLGRWDVAVRLYREALRFDPKIAIKFNNRFPTPAHLDGPNCVESPIFIVGCGHSGTSILTRVIGAHPCIKPIERESALFLRSDETIRQTMDEWDKDAQTPPNRRWVEKTPPHVFQIARFMGFRPEAKFIVPLRDGRDVIASLKNRSGYESVRDRIDRWVYDNKAAIAFEGHPNIMFVKYEDLVVKTGDTLKRVCDFIGEATSVEMLRYHSSAANWYSDVNGKPDEIKSAQDHNQLRNWQINQPIFDGRGKWKKALSSAEIRAIKDSEAQELLEKFDYVEGRDW